MLELCNIDVNNFETFTVKPEELRNFGNQLKNKLYAYFVKSWKDQIQQGGNTGKLRTFKKLKIHFGFEKYLSEIHNIKTSCYKITNFST